ncbi:hemocyte protein-glutamine gamma-glutamyltransferase [Diabrotica virgifera virgifera]|uniref:Transglutaminase-like domain-containing protein n=2 Tax=Diabrotica virgifera virgifera TaxID=50390 RepID=A0ABM5KMB5_DIAVI|nr:hemocyte protein-glutamine gamma-glutamyltransferase [Diabrotica virgifera virgifera]
MSLGTDMFYMYPKENAKLHKTDQYELVDEEDVPVLRRGQKFTVALRFSRDYDPKTDMIRISFNFGPRPHPIKGTAGIFVVDPAKRSNIDTEKPMWFGNVLEARGQSLTLEIYSPPGIPVGLWAVKVETRVRNSSEEPVVYDYPGDLYFICNPWNCHDMVYMPETRLLEEYILNDTGKIWVGPLGTTKGREWIFGQFDSCTLPAIQLMFEKSGLPWASRGDPIKLTRIISKMVNSNDDDGILVGRWDGQYEDGTAPSAWTGSVPILQQYLDTEQPVSYGQCWVFSGVCTTIARALGIPSRVVSNLVSAHDANSTLTVDKYFNEHNEELPFDPNNPEGEDSIWNYHVWNDVYMARPDLPPGYGGWQAIDATPQEPSSGFYQCGPASLEAIKKGQVGYNFDVGFMVASVNADLMRWKVDHSNVLGYKRIYCNKYHVGRYILTKQPFMYDYNGDRDRQDITRLYKPEEGSKAERLSLLNAVRGTEAAKRFFDMPDEETEDCEFTLQDLDQIKIGENFSVVVKIKNNSNSQRHIKVHLSAGTVYYNGLKAHPISKDEGEFNLKPHSTEELRLNVTADEYLDKLVEYCIMKIYAIASVSETNQTWADEDDFQVVRPNIDIKVPHTIVNKKPTTVGLKFVNPLKKALTNGKFHISGASLLKNQVIGVPDVKPGTVIRIETSIVPKYEGEQKLVATFTSRELLDITGTAKVEVVSEEE